MILRAVAMTTPDDMEARVVEALRRALKVEASQYGVFADNCGADWWFEGYITPDALARAVIAEITGGDGDG